jgi:Ca2+-binding RTX toxin-like protein
VRVPLIHVAALPVFALGALLLLVGKGAAAPAQIDCFGAPATIVGTPGDDTLVGTPGPDVIVGLGGSDDLDGGGGDDRICGDEGLDFLVGGSGNDLLDGGVDSDLLAGREGDDRLDGGSGPDILIAGPGANTLSGGPDTGLDFEDEDFAGYSGSPSPVRVNLAEGRASGWGADTLSSIETVSGSDFNDTLIGDGLDNNFWGGDGNDEIRGAGGADRALFDRSVTASLVTGSATGEGTDRLISVEDLQGSDGNDRLTGNGGPNDMNGGLGGRDLLLGGGGEDLLLAGGPSTLDGGPGQDLLAGRRDSDRLLGGPGDDALLGQDGNDVLRGGAGEDLLSGEQDDDSIEGGPGVEDFSDYLFSDGGVRVDLARGSASGAGTDRLVGVEGVLGSLYDDELVGNAAANSLFGYGGVDRVVGAAGADFLDGGGDGDVLRPGTGADYCLQNISGCEITGVPEIPGVAPTPPGAGSVRPSTTPPSRALVVKRPVIAATARRQAGVRAVELHAAAGLPFARKLLLTKHDLVGSAGQTGTFKYAAEPVCYAIRAPYSTEIAPPRRVDPASADGGPEEAWWQGTLYRATASGRRYKPFKKTAWARASLGTTAVVGVTIWQNATKRRAFPTAVRVRVPAGRYVWKGNIYWVRTGGQVFAPVEPHIIRARTVQHNKHCQFG